MEPRPAATVIVARSVNGDLEVLALRRTGRSRFAPGFVVFPGGAIEPEDRTLAASLFGDPEEAPRACALRELYEEAGLLLTSGGLIAGSPGSSIEALSFDPPPIEALAEVARWVAPEFLEVRFDARFYASAAPPGLEPVADGAEIDRAWWAKPEDLLAEARTGEAPLMWPTLVTLGALSECRTVEDVLGLRIDQVPRPG